MGASCAGGSLGATRASAAEGGGDAISAWIAEECGEAQARLGPRDDGGRGKVAWGSGECGHREGTPSLEEIPGGSYHVKFF